MYRVVTEANAVVISEVVAADDYNLKTYIVMEYCDKGTLESHRYAVSLATANAYSLSAVLFHSIQCRDGKLVVSCLCCF